MRQIDWSSAPAEATHWDCRQFVSPAFMKKLSGADNWLFYSGGNWHIYGMLSPAEESKLIPRPTIQEWTGEGLPPVGTVCEFRVKEGDWRQCEVIAHKSEVAICWIHCNKILSTGGASVRPIRTPEQIAEEVRDKAIADLYFTINWNEGRETWPIISSGRKADYAKAIDAGWQQVTQ